MHLTSGARRSMKSFLQDFLEFLFLISLDKTTATTKSISHAQASIEAARDWDSHWLVDKHERGPRRGDSCSKVNGREVAMSDTKKHNLTKS